MPHLIDQTLGGYRITEQIGIGGMATVFKAHQPSMDRYVAFKVISTHLAQDPTFVQRFQQEVKVIAKLAYQVTADDGSGSTNPAPAVNVYYCTKTREAFPSAIPDMG